MAERVEFTRVQSRPASKPDLADLSIAVVAGLGLAITALFLCVLPFTRDVNGSRDFVSYWATGEQLLRHQNPYDLEAIAALEHSANLDPRAVLIMRNVPLALPLAYIFGILGLRVAAIVWSPFLLTCLVVCVNLVRRLYGSPPGKAYWLGLAFTPALLCVIMGQTSILLLLGLVLFLTWHKNRPYAAGAALWLCILKPHMFLPFAVVLLAWIFVSRSYRVLGGALTAGVIGATSTTAIDPRAWSQYAFYMRNSSVTHEFTPCWGDLFRDSINPASQWLALVPAMIGCIWALAYFWPRRRNWDWLEHGSALMLVSLLVAPFGWIFDHSVAIPALLHGAFLQRSRQLLTILAILILALDFEIPFVKLASPLWLWAAPAWITWYVFAGLSARQRAASH
jgi:hypothetical protein